MLYEVITKYSRKMIEDLEGTAKIYKAKGLAWMKAGGTVDARITSYNVCYTKLLREFRIHPVGPVRFKEIPRRLDSVLPVP